MSWESPLEAIFSSFTSYEHNIEFTPLCFSYEIYRGKVEYKEKTKSKQWKKFTMKTENGQYFAAVLFFNFYQT